jgi:ABC-2 type transport system permease protein
MLVNEPRVVRAILWKDFTAIRRSKAVMLPMLVVPFVLLVVLPAVLGLIASHADNPDLSRLFSKLPHQVVDPIARLPQHEQLVVLINGYLLAPLFLIVPLMVSAVLAADAFAGEKERKTMEHLLHLPATDRDLFVAKVLSAYIPALVVSWVGFGCFLVVANTVSWPVMHRIFLPTTLWMLMIFWVAPAVSSVGLGVMTRVSARTRTTQEANQLGGAVILPLIFASLGQASGLLVLSPYVAIATGAGLWLIGLLLLRGGIHRFTRDRLAMSC